MNAPDPQTLRAIPLDTLLEWYRDRVELSSVRAVAEACGVGRTTLQKFVNGETDPHPRTRRLLALYYVARTADAVDEARAAFNRAAEVCAGLDRGSVYAGLLAAVERLYDGAGVNPPGWLRELSQEQVQNGGRLGPV